MQFPDPLDPIWNKDQYQDRIAIGLNPGNTPTELKVRNDNSFGYTNQMRFRPSTTAAPTSASPTATSRAASSARCGSATSD